MKRLITLPIALFVLALVGVNTEPAVAQGDLQTHYWLSRPLPPPANLVSEYGFPYGSTRSGRSPIHHGVDIVNRRGTPVLAAADGTIYYAGSDDERQFGPYTKFYGNVVVVQHELTAPEGGTVFTLYGHLNTIGVGAGQRVARGQQLGTVGMTGIAIASHLHFEVRLGNPDDYNATRNPELWYAPLPGRGRIVGRVVDANGGLGMGLRLNLAGRGLYSIWTYEDASMRADPGYNENFAIGDLFPGCYYLRARNGRGGYAYANRHCLAAGQTLFVEVKLKPM